jgi:UDP-N-acetylglucosamine--N-acetylmuramyl-(pentapeptide) pyrophosphoryl-undecaprenol N-acetylglucosamine transferase
MKVLIAAGGTAGHLFPAQQLAELLEKDCEVILAGHHLEKSPYLQKSRFRFCDCESAPFGKQFFVALLRGLWKSIRLLLSFKPDVVVGFGSYHTAPLLLASVLLRKKIVLYEANRSMGKVNQLFTPFAKKIAVQFLNSEKYTRVPLFPWIQKEKPMKAAALQAYGLDPRAKTILVFGGSQGAKFLNETMPKVPLAAEVQLIHLAGSDEAAKMTAESYAKAGIRAVVKSFEPNMAQAYAAADFAVCRSGAGTMAELIRYGVPSLLIPYPYAYGHQELNANYLKDLGGAKVLLQQNAAPEEIWKQIRDIDIHAMRVALRSAEEQNQSLMGLDELVKRC